MKRAHPRFWLVALALLSAPTAHATVTLQLGADRLNDANGSAAPASTLVLIVADTDANGLGAAITGNIAKNAPLNGANGDDLIVFRTDLTTSGVTNRLGVLYASAAGLSFGDDPKAKWGPSDPLYLVWFPTLTSASTNLSAGVPYGVIPIGSTPPDGGLISATYVTPINTNFYRDTASPGVSSNTAADQISSTGAAPEIAVSGTNGITDGSTSASVANGTDFGSTAAAVGTVVRTFTITNTGTAPLTLQTVGTAGPNASDFSVTSQPVSPVASGGGTTTFQITFDPAAIGVRTATVTFGNNDSDESPFDFAISGTGTNSTPSGLTLDNLSLPENSGPNAQVGLLAALDPDGGAGYTFALTGGTGSDNNGLFNISGNTLRMSSSADYETQSSYSVRIRVTDPGGLVADASFLITVLDVNEAPTGIALSSTSLPENSGALVTVGSLSASDPEGEAHTFSLQPGTGGEDNSAFDIAGTTLRLKQDADYETKKQYAVNIRATDSGGLNFDKAFLITISDVNESPSSLTLSANSIAEGSLVGTKVGTLSVMDPDAGDTHIYTFSSGTGGDDNSSFLIDGADLKLNTVPDFETKDTYAIRIRATDSGSSPLYVEATFTIQITDVDETPGDITLTSATIAENTQASAPIGTLSVSNSPVLPVTFELVDGEGSTQNSKFSIPAGSNILLFDEVADYEQRNSYSIRVKATDSSSPPRIAYEQLTITVTNVNEPPTNLRLSSTSFPENTAQGTGVATISVDDPDLGDVPSFELVPGVDDNSKFTLQGSTLQLNAAADYETQSTYHIRLRATDSGSPKLDTEESFALNVTNVNEPPVFTVGTAQTWAPGTAGPKSFPNWATGIDDGDANDLQTLSFQVAVASGDALFSVAPTISTDGTLSYTLSGTSGTASLSVTLTDDNSINGTPAITTTGQTFVVSVTASQIAVTGDGSFGVVPVASGAAVRTFTITNLGTGDLSLGTLSRGGSHPDDFSITASPVSPVEPSKATTFQIAFDPAEPGLREATISIPTNDPDQNPFVLALAGTGGVPELEVADGATQLTDGSSTLIFTGVGPGSVGSKTLTLRNSGTSPLTGLDLKFIGDDAAKFSKSLSRDSLDPGESLPVAISFAPQISGAHSATLQIRSNDADEDPFDIDLSCFVDGRSAKPVITPDSEAERSFIDAPSWDASAAGSYEGLLRAGTAVVGAVSNLKVSAPPADAAGTGGAVTGTIRMNGATVPLKGTFDAAGHLFTSFDANPRFDLSLKKTPKGFAISGTITLNGFTADAWLPQAPFSATNPVPTDLAATGPYTLLLPSSPGWGTDQPGGDGWATASLSSSGKFTLTGALGDGTKFTESGNLSADGQVALYAELYSKNPGKGKIGGLLAFRDLDRSDVDGRLQWTKGEDTRNPVREKLYPGGFDEPVWAVGERFQPAAATPFLLSDLANQHYNAELSLVGPTAPLTESGSLDKVVSWLPNNTFLHYGPQALSGSASAKNGSVTGSFFDSTAKVRVSFTGVVLQTKQSLAAGVFVNGNSSGSVRIVPGNPVYPGKEPAPALTQLERPEPASDPSITPQSTFPTAAAGTYNGVLTRKDPLSNQDDGVAGAIEAATLTPAGGISATLWIEGRRTGFSGTIGQTIPLPNGGTVDLQIANLDGVTDGFVLTGAVVVDSVSYTLNAQRLPAGPSPWKNAYTLAVLAPQSVTTATEPGGDAYGTVTVATSGTCTGTVTLPDGTKVTLAGHVGNSYTSDGNTTAVWSFHRGLYGKTPKGYLAGKLTFRQIENVSDFDGQWRWVKQSGAAPVNVYPAIDTTRDVIGSIYAAPLPNTRAMNLANGTDNVWIQFDGADLSSLPALTLLHKDLTGTWQLNNSIIHYGPQTVKLTFASATGRLTGSYKDTANGITFSFGGVLLQDQNRLTGSYLTQGNSGRFLIQPR